MLLWIVVSCGSTVTESQIGRIRSKLDVVRPLGRSSELDASITLAGPDPALNLAGLGPDVQAQRFRQIVSGVRVVTCLVALGLVVSSVVDHSAGLFFWTFVVICYNALRLVRPIQFEELTANVAQVIVEVAVHAIASGLTGAWSSPFVFPLLTAIIVAGFARGIWPALRLGIATAISVSIVEIYLFSDIASVWVTNAQWSLFLVTVGIMSGYARRILGEAQTSHSLAMSHVASLADANRLLSSLHSVAQVLPASLDLEEVLDSTMSRLRGLFAYEAACLLLLDDTDGSWRVARWDGYRQDTMIEQSELPSVMRKAIVDRTVHTVRDLSRRGGGLAPHMESGLYGVLMARGEFVGMVALESEKPDAYESRDGDLLDGFLEPAALAIDNARVFDRLRTVGADEERTRIARDLHDRIGQSLAYIAFELDRLVRGYEDGKDLGPSLSQLRVDVRGVIGEVRDTLYDLRTDVSEVQDFAATMEEFLERVKTRSGLETQLIVDESERLPLLPERELWRIAQEAVINVERHARAEGVSVTWRSNGRAALLEVADNGVGFPEGKAGRLDSYGIMGMRERASSIGATMRIASKPGRGTVVQCRLDAG